MKIISTFCALLLLGGVAGGAETFFVTQHLDLRPVYDTTAAKLTNIVLYDHASASAYQSNEAVVVVPLAARLTIPAGLPPAYAPLGSSGSPIWILPQSFTAGLVFLGISVEDPSMAAFDDPGELRLLAVDTLRTNAARGHFLMWDDAPMFFMNSRDGVSAADSFPLFPTSQSHNHINWGFTTSGIYRLTFQFIGQRFGDATNMASPPTTFVFHVLPLSPIESWQTNNWPSTAGQSLVGWGADPDGDGIPNLSEYGFGTNPNQAGATNLPSYLVVNVSGTNYGALRYTRSKAATDVVLTPEMAPAPSGPWTAMTNLVSTVDQGATQLITYRDPNPVAATTNRYGRVRVSLP